VTGVIAGNISDEATTRVGNIFAEAMRGFQLPVASSTLDLESKIIRSKEWRYMARSHFQSSAYFTRSSASGAIDASAPAVTLNPLRRSAF
jgi:hypothetical protein